MSTNVEAARNLIYLWDIINTNKTRSPWLPRYILDDYNAVSYAMRNYKDGWDGIKDVGQLDRMEKTVFSSWINKARELFAEHNDSNNDSYKSKLELIQRIQIDIDWWQDNQPTPLNNKNIDLKCLVTSNHKEHAEHQDLHKEWYSMWLNTGWIQDKDILIEFLIDSILSNNVDIVKRIVKEYSIDINQYVPSENIAISDRLRNDYKIRNLKNVKLGFFARSKDMSQALLDLGFNYDVKVSADMSLYDLIKKKNYVDFLSSKERTRVVRFVDDLTIENKPKESEHTTLSDIKNSKTKDELDTTLRRIDFANIRDENGCNVLHMIAKHTPQFLKSYAKQKKYAKLMNTTDSEGRYPIEYFMGFSNTTILKKNLSKIEAINTENNFPRPDWLEVKLIIAENQLTWSGIDRIESSVWKQRTPQDFSESLRTARGKKLINILANQFKYKLISYYDMRTDGPYCGMDICKYTDSPTEEYGFLKLAKTNDEIKFALMQSWIIFFSQNNKDSRLNADFHKKINSDLILNLIDRAIEEGVNVEEIKNKMEDHFEIFLYQRFKEVMSESFGEWNQLVEKTEKSKLMKIVESKPPRASKEVYSVL